ncbi:MAG TPA: cupin domain-containing protein [Rhodanobacteraceae bacterium]|jgi:50S ribosomal protein L16 3-hydroxylase|nr:cupin domain-containing protein [Rhodanobacteraceae bacterium]
MPATRPAFPIEIHASARHLLGIPPARFLRDYWQKRPLLIRNAFPDFRLPLSPDDVAGLACMQGALARIVLHDARRDRWTLRNGPFDDTTFAKLPKSNWTLLVQDVDKWDADTAALLEHFNFIPSWRIDDVMISYATDGGGVGAHVDQYDVFLLQGLGRRRWSIDTRPDPPTAFREDVELKLLETFSPTHTWTLDAGDMLYLPPGVPHDGVADGECMTFSIGMRAPATGELLFDFAAHVAETLPESQRFADPDLEPAGEPGEIDASALRRAQRAVGAAAGMLDDDAFADWFGGFITRYRAAQSAVPRKRGIDRASLAEGLPRSVLERDPWSRFAWRRRGNGARLYVAGNAMDAPLAWARELASGGREFDGARLARLPQQTHGMALLATLIDGGHLHRRKR